MIIIFNFDLLFSKLIFSLFFRLPERNVLDPNGPYISTSQTKIRHNFGILSIARLQSTPTYIEA